MPFVRGRGYWSRDGGIGSIGRGVGRRSRRSAAVSARILTARGTKGDLSMSTSAEVVGIGVCDRRPRKVTAGASSARSSTRSDRREMAPVLSPEIRMDPRRCPRGAAGQCSSRPRRSAAKDTMRRCGRVEADDHFEACALRAQPTMLCAEMRSSAIRRKSSKLF